MHILHLRQFLQQLLHQTNTALCMTLKQKDKSLGNSTRRGGFSIVRAFVPLFVYAAGIINPLHIERLLCKDSLWGLTMP